jgi:hypothetical protein
LEQALRQALVERSVEEQVEWLAAQKEVRSLPMSS